MKSLSKSLVVLMAILGLVLGGFSVAANAKTKHPTKHHHALKMEKKQVNYKKSEKK